MNIFGGNTGMTYEDVQRKRATADRVAASLGDTPRNVGEGLHAIGKALMVRGIEKRTSRRMDELKTEADDMWSSVFGGMGGGAPSPALGASVPPVSTSNVEGQAVADDTMTALGKEPMRPFRDAIASIESAGSGDYQAVGPAHPELGRAFGRYQVMEANIAPWSREVLGREVTPQEFMENPRIQDAIFDGKFGQYVEKFGPDGAAQAWFGGEGGVGKTGRRDSLGTSIGEYTDKFNSAIGGGGVAPTRIASTQAIAEALGNPIIRQDPGKVAILQALLQQQLAPPPSMTPYQQAQIDLRRQEMSADATGGDSTEYGLTPQYITTPDGELQMIQLSKDGTAKVVDLPEGAAIQKGVEKLDLGTNFQWYNTVTGEPIGEPIPKDLRGAEAEKAAGSTEGKAAAEGKIAAPEIIAKAQDMKTLIDSVINDPALSSITGNIQGRLPAGIPGVTGGQAGTDLSVKIRQIGGKAFLEAFETLKGGGQITEREGQAAKDAIARLETAQSDGEFRAALRELKEIADRGLTRAQGKLGIEPSAPPPADKAATHRFNPETGEIEATQ